MRVLLVSQDSKLFHMRGLAESLRRLGAETEVLPFSRYAYLSPHFTLVPSTELLKRILDFRADVVFTDIFHWDTWFSKLVGCPVLAHMRGDFWTEFAYLYYTRVRHRPPLARLTTMWVRFVMERGLDLAHTIMPICQWLAEIVKHHRPEKKIRILYQPVEPKLWTYDQVTEESHLDHPAVVSVFDFNILPKVHGLIRFLDAARSMPHINFYVAGSGPHLGSVLSCNPPRNVRFIGRLSYPDGVRAFLAEGDIFLHPSGQDACPLTVLEAQLMQKPVIATNVGGIPETVANDDLLVRDGDTAGWIAKIQYLIEHPDEREVTGRLGRRFVESKFSMAEISKNLYDFIKTVAE